MKRSGIYQHLGLLSEPTRVRLLILLEREELGVGELTRIVQLPQSTVSRHLKALEVAGWVERRSEGTSSLVRMGGPGLNEQSLALWAVVSSSHAEHHLSDEDLRRLDGVLAARRIDSKAFFGRVAAEWDNVRRALFGSSFALPALLTLMASDLVVADLGCGTGEVAAQLAPIFGKVIAIDRESAMLECASQRLDDFDNIDLVQADLLDLPMDDGSIDVAVLALVLHHIESPELLLSEVRRVLRPGGKALVVDMVEHDRERYRQSMGHHHLGFSHAAVTAHAQKAGLKLAHHRIMPQDSEAQGPALFAALLVLEKVS